MRCEAGPTISVTHQSNHGNRASLVVECSRTISSRCLAICSQTTAARHPSYGSELKEWVRHAYTRSFKIFGPDKTFPIRRTRTLDPSVRDPLGQPVARLQGHTHRKPKDAKSSVLGRKNGWVRPGRGSLARRASAYSKRSQHQAVHAAWDATLERLSSTKGSGSTDTRTYDL